MSRAHPGSQPGAKGDRFRDRNADKVLKHEFQKIYSVCLRVPPRTRTTHNVGPVSIQEVGPETALQGKGLMGSD